MQGMGCSIDPWIQLVQACLRSPERFWDIRVPKIDSIFDSHYATSRPASVALRYAAFGCSLGIPFGAFGTSGIRVASRLPGTTRLRFALHGGQRSRGCSRIATTDDGHCARHEGDRRPGAWGGKSKGYGHKWRALRAVVLERDNHLCQPCRRAGRLTVASEVDHITPRSLGGDESPENLQAIAGLAAFLKRAQRAPQRAMAPPPRVVSLG